MIIYSFEVIINCNFPNQNIVHLNKLRHHSTCLIALVNKILPSHSGLLRKNVDPLPRPPLEKSLVDDSFECKITVMCLA